MRSDDIEKFVFQRPFEPFRLTLTNGTVYDIHHPEMAMVGYSSVTVGVPRSSESGHKYDHAVFVSLNHIMQVEPLATAPSQGSKSQT